MPGGVPSRWRTPSDRSPERRRACPSSRDLRGRRRSEPSEHAKQRWPCIPSPQDLAPARCSRPAPSAMRNPISCVRCATDETTSRRRCQPPPAPVPRRAKLPNSSRRETIAGDRLVRRADPSSCTSAIGRSGSSALNRPPAMASLHGGRVARRPHRHARRPATGSARTARRSPGNPSSLGRRCAPSR